MWRAASAILGHCYPSPLCMLGSPCQRKSQRHDARRPRPTPEVAKRLSSFALLKASQKCPTKSTGSVTASTEIRGYQREAHLRCPKACLVRGPHAVRPRSPAVVAKICTRGHRAPICRHHRPAIRVHDVSTAGGTERQHAGIEAVAEPADGLARRRTVHGGCYGGTGTPEEVPSAEIARLQGNQGSPCRRGPPALALGARPRPYFTVAFNLNGRCDDRHQAKTLRKCAEYKADVEPRS
jgi:hypothetical protein